MALLGRDTWVKGPFGEGVEVLLETFRGEESLGRPYRYSVGLLSHDPVLDSNHVLGRPLSVGIKLETGGQRFFHGIISSFAKTGATTRYAHYEATCTMGYQSSPGSERFHREATSDPGCHSGKTEAWIARLL